VGNSALHVPNGAVTPVTVAPRGEVGAVGGVPLSVMLGFPESSGSGKGHLNSMTCPQAMLLISMNPTPLPSPPHFAQGPCVAGKRIRRKQTRPES
jgi:hypothetical protein